VSHREIDRLAGRGVELAHVRQGVFAHADARLHQVAQLEQPDAEAIAARVGALDQAIVHEGSEDAVRGRGCRPLVWAKAFSAAGWACRASASRSLVIRWMTWMEFLDSALAMGRVDIERRNSIPTFGMAGAVGD